MNIALDQIKKQAPEGATHYREYTGQYFKISSKEWLVFRNGKFQKWQSSRFINIKPLN